VDRDHRQRRCRRLGEDHGRSAAPARVGHRPTTD
jgi:hypothetical protein